MVESAMVEDFHTITGTESADRGEVVVSDVIHVQKVLGEAARDDCQQ
jgi:hypothetical protein